MLKVNYQGHPTDREYMFGADLLSPKVMKNWSIL